MPSPITFRPDSEVERALALLTADGTTTSDAIRAAIVASAHRQAAHRLREEAAALAADSDDRAEAARVLQDLETLRAW